MYYCEECKHEFENPKFEETTFEDYYGVGSLFPTSHKCTIKHCPHCDSENIEEMEKCDRCEEYCRYEDLTDTEGLANGGIGYLCPDCLRDCDIEYF